jgi:chromosome segregation ATPase
MQVLHDTSDKEKKPMKIVPEGDNEKMEELDTEEAIETMEAIDPEETIDAADENQEAEEEEVEEPQEEVEEVEAAPKKKSRLQRRIDELVRERAAEREEKAKLASQIETLNKELQRKSTLNNDYNTLQQDYYENQIKSATKTLEAARSAYRSAKETGNTDEEIRIAEEIADAKFELKDLERQKHLFDRRQKTTAQQAEQMQQPVPTQQPQPQPQAQPDPRALQWAQVNTWFGQDDAKTGAAYAIDARLKMEGYDPSSEEYYSELDRQLGIAFPDLKKGNAKPKQVVASVSRAPSAPNNKVSLNNRQMAMARKLGVPLEEYAKFVRNANDQ